MNTKEIHELRFAYKIRAALNESAEQVPAHVAARLAAARRTALAAKKAEAPETVQQLAMAGHRGSSNGRSGGHSGGFFRRFGVAWAMIALAAGLFGVYQWQQQDRVDELADVDAAMLLDDLPPAAYADHGFHVFLRRGQ
jgi:hypothetical protein